MSRKGHHNFVKRPGVTDAVVRTIVLERADTAFFSDEGRLPLTPSEAYDAGFMGGFGEGALGTDCLRAFDLGFGSFENEVHDPYAGDFCDTDWGYANSSYGDSRYHEEGYGPMEGVWPAFFEAECQRTREMDLMWRLIEEGHERPPQWFTLVKDYNSAERGTW